MIVNVPIQWQIFVEFRNPEILCWTDLNSVMKSLTDNTALPNSAVKLTDALQGVDPILYRGLLSGVLSKVLEDKSKNQKDPKSENLTINKILK